MSRSAVRHVHKRQISAAHDNNGGLDEQELPEQLQGETIVLQGIDPVEEHSRAVSPGNDRFYVSPAHRKKQMQEVFGVPSLSILSYASHSPVPLNIGVHTASYSPCKTHLQAYGSAKMDRISLTARQGRLSTPLEPPASMWPSMRCGETLTLQDMQRYCRYAGSVDMYVQLVGCIVDALQR